MPKGLLIGLGAGIASAALFYSAARGSPMLGTLLLLLTPLPSLLAGLGWGWISAAASALAGLLLMSVLASLPFAIAYLIALGLPVVLATYLAFLSRPDPDALGKQEWYPPGRLVAAMTLYAGSLPVAALAFTEGTYDALRTPMVEFLRLMSSQTAAELGVQGLTEDHIQSLAELFVRCLPAVFAAYWLGILLLNLYLAGRIARTSGRLGRDWPDLATLTYPRGFALLMGIALIASFVPGPVGIAGTSFSGALLFAHLIVGLAVLHFVARSRAPWLLWCVYAALLFLGPYAALAIILGGLLDPLFNLRQRFSAPPTT